MADIVGKGTMKDRVGKMNETAAVGPSSWAMKMLMKQGWKECVSHTIDVLRWKQGPVLIHQHYTMASHFGRKEDEAITKQLTRQAVA